MRRGIASTAKRLLGAGLGAGFWVVVVASPARAVTLGPATVTTLPPLAVAPGPVAVGPVTVDANASVTPDGAHAGVTTGGLPVAGGGPDLGLSVGSNGAQVGVGGVDAGVVLSPPPAIAPGGPSSGGDVSASTPPVVAAPGSSSARAGGSSNLNRAPVSAPISPAAAHPQVVALSNGSPVAVTGGVDAPRARNWWSLATGVARSWFLWVVLLLAAIVLRNRVGAAARDQRGVSVARST